MFPRCEDGFRSPSQLRQRLKAARLARSAAHPGEPLKIEGLLIIFRAERKREAARFLLVCFGMPFAALPGPPQRSRSSANREVMLPVAKSLPQDIASSCDH